MEGLVVSLDFALTVLLFLPGGYESGASVLGDLARHLVAGHRLVVLHAQRYEEAPHFAQDFLILLELVQLEAGGR